MMNRKCILISLVLLFCFMLPVVAENREALVIGNGTYKTKNMQDLPNPVNDAKEISEKLKKLDFNVVLITDADVKTMDSELKEFYKRSSKAQISMIYYAGHGIESDGINYLIPVENSITADDELKRNAVDLTHVINKLSDSTTGKYIIILDACRDNPIKKTRGGGSRGLQPAKIDETAEGVIVYACAPGEAANDGDGKHSPFTNALINHLEDKISFDEIIKAVRADVKAITKNQQNPWSNDTTTAPIYLNGTGGRANPVVYDDNIKKQGVNPVALSILLFLILLVIVVVLFIVFTAKGNVFLNSTKEKVSTAAAISSGFMKDSLNTAKVKINEKKNKISEKKNMLASEIAAKKEKDEADLHRGEQFFLKSKLINKSVYFAETPVTVAQYNQITGKNVLGNSDEPVTNVSYYDAVQFLNQLSKNENLEQVYDLSNPAEIKVDLEKNGWRLPNEEEWIYASRGSYLSFDAAWYIENSDNELHDCGLKQPNANGLYDMYGLVWEWCNDSVNEKYKVLKGGAWDCSAKFCNSYYSHKAVPNFKSDAAGFRGVRNK